MKISRSTVHLYSTVQSVNHGVQGLGQNMVQHFYQKIKYQYVKVYMQVIG